MSKAVYDRVAEELAVRRKNPFTRERAFSGRIVCGSCGGTYGSRIWHSNDRYRKSVRVCHNRYKDGIRCHNPAVDDAQLLSMFTDLMKQFINEHPDLLLSLDGILIKTIRGQKQFGDKEERLAEIRDQLKDPEITYREDICYVLLKGGVVDNTGVCLRLIDGTENRINFCKESKRSRQAK